MVILQLAVSDDDGTSGGELFVEVVSVELLERGELIIRMDTVFQGAGKFIEEVGSAGMDFEIFFVRLGLEFDVVVGLGVEVVDGGVVPGEGFGDGGEGERLGASIHAGLDVVDADDDLIGIFLTERGYLHVDVGGPVFDEEPVGDGKGALGLECVEDVCFGEVGEETGKIFGIDGLFGVLPAELEEVCSFLFDAEGTVAGIGVVFVEFVCFGVDDIDGEVVSGECFGNTGKGECVLLFELLLFLSSDLVINIRHTDDDVFAVIRVGVYGLHAVVV